MTIFWLLSVVLSLWIISLFTPPTCFFGLHWWKKERTVTGEDDGIVYSHWKTCHLCHTSNLEAIVELRHRKPRIVSGGMEHRAKRDRGATRLLEAFKLILGGERQ